MLNIKQFVNPVVEGVSKLSFQCGSRDAKFCVSTIWLDKLLILNVLYVVANIETRHATSLLMAKSHFDTPSTVIILIHPLVAHKRNYATMPPHLLPLHIVCKSANKF